MGKNSRQEYTPSAEYAELFINDDYQGTYLIGQKVEESKESEGNESPSLEKKIEDLEDKLKRTLADMENQRRRFEKEKEEAFDYGGFSFAREALNLIDNLERSKVTLQSDEELKNSKVILNLVNYYGKEKTKTIKYNSVIQIQILSINKTL